MSFFQKLKCMAYTAYDWAKSQWPTRIIFYAGEKYEHYADVVATGIVVAVNGGALDGDTTFDIVADGFGPLHCEVTPCYPQDISKLAVGTRVRVMGTHTWDPTHLGTPGHWEIHPVKDLVIL